MKIYRQMKIKGLFVGDIFTTTFKNRKLVQFRLHTSNSLTPETKVYKDKRKTLDLWTFKELNML